MIWPVLLIIPFIISFYYYKRNWQPHIPSFFSKKELIRIGHRGAPLLAHENTVSSFIKAVETDIDGIELDVQFSSDKQLIVYHDWACKALIGPVKYIDKTPYSKLEKIRFNNKKINKMPLFTEVLGVLPENYIKIIEIKSRHVFDSGIEKNTLDILQKYNFTESAIISSFNPFVIRRVRKFNPNIQTAYLWTKNNPQFIINSPLWAWWCKPDGFHADIDFLDINLAQWIRRKKMSLLAYTILTQEQLAKAHELGLDGIIVDDPDLNYGV